MRCSVKTIIAFIIRLPLIAAVPTKSFIYVVPDGYGAASQALARDFRSQKQGKSSNGHPTPVELAVDTMVIGTVRTHSRNKRITDSAAAATAFACGIKTNNGVIGMTEDGEPQGSILEAAHLAGLKTGLVATSRITHATPAGYCSHVLDRSKEDKVAAQQIGKKHPFGPFVDILMGGGWNHYLPKGKGGARKDNVNLVEWAQDEANYTCVTTKNAMEKISKDYRVQLPFLGLFAESHMQYEHDREWRAPTEPTLLEMTKYAINTLHNATEESSKGFFIMIEASRIDHSGHDNDAMAHIKEVLMYNDVMAWLKDFVSANPEIQLLSAADHECGGLTLIDKYNPMAFDDLSRYTASVLAQTHDDHKKGKTIEAKTLYGKHQLVADEWVNWGNTGNGKLKTIKKMNKIYKKKGKDGLKLALGRFFSKKGGARWSTTKHSAVDVLLHGHADADKFAIMRKKLSGSIDNTEIPKYIEHALNLDMRKATEILRKKMKTKRSDEDQT